MKGFFWLEVLSTALFRKVRLVILLLLRYLSFISNPILSLSRTCDRSSNAVGAERVCYASLWRDRFALDNVDSSRVCWLLRLLLLRAAK